MADDVQDVVTQIDKEPAPAAAPTPTPAVTVADPDDAEVAAALAAVDAEANPAAQPQASSAPAPTPTPAAPSAPAAAPPPPVTTEAPVMIPKGRFDEVLSKSAEKDQVIARLQGENEALKMVVKPAAPGTPTQPAAPAETHAQKLDRIYAAKEALAKKFDDGELGLAQMRREERMLDDELEQVREARLETRFKASNPPPQQTAPAPDMRLEEKFEDLETKHAYLKAPEVMRDDRWQFLLTEAASQLRAEGVLTLPEGAPLPPTLRFKLGERVAQLSDTYGPIWGAKAPQPSAQPKPGVPPIVQARANKLEQASNAPPDLNRLTPQGGQAEYTEDQVAMMSDEEILALPASVRAKFSTA